MTPIIENVTGLHEPSVPLNNEQRLTMFNEIYNVFTRHGYHLVPIIELKEGEPA